GVAGDEQRADRARVVGFEVGDDLLDAVVLGDDVLDQAACRVVGEACQGGIEVLVIDVAQRCDAELGGGGFAAAAAFAITAVGVGVFDAGVDDQHAQS